MALILSALISLEMLGVAAGMDGRSAIVGSMIDVFISGIFPSTSL